MPTGIYKRKPFSAKHKAKLRKLHLGKKKSDAHKKKLSEAKTRFYRNGGVSPQKGKKASRELRKKISMAHVGKQAGEKNPNWKGGVTPVNSRIRKTTEYKLWRISVFERDDYTCRFCGARGVEIHADHIKPFALFPELRFAIDNGRTLCEPCHKKTDTWGYNKNTMKNI